MRPNNSNGPTYTGPTRYKTMDAFDRLPKAVRQALREADHNWSAAQCLHLFRKKGFRRGADLIAVIKDRDRARHRADADKGLICPDQR